ncbi:MarC family protein [Moraxella sp. ZY200743]|uniref:MarC family protein n=1 Tax=Moraxella sp. ZY200743 TaxID=2911970 RepID=UPI003D7E4DCA
MEIDIVKITLAFVVLINPLGALMLFLHFTNGHSDNAKKKVARTACLTVFITISFFVLLGELLLQVLGISLGSFRMAGGLLLLLIALNMMSAGNNPAKPQEKDVDDEISERSQVGGLASVAVVPIAIPMMIGPGGISTVIIYAAEYNSLAGILMILASGLAISLFCYACLMGAGRISKVLGNTGLNVINRVMGIILAALSIEIMVNGLRTLFPQLG